MICNFCDQNIAPNEPHTECDMTPGDTCNNTNCAYRWCIHAGACVD